ncbi:MAG: hypothetical protein OXF09_04815 [Hyphomicrobiales bacterium]|nr:hypothetical protein [Hyphomicrobiales bacterium]
MKTTRTTIFAIAVMVFAFNANLATAIEREIKFIPDCHRNPTQAGCQVAEVDDLNNPDQAGDESEVADSGEEGSTSEAGATGQ